ncbi:MAG: hypothetical protein QNL52_09065, partial [Synechococcus sp. ChBW.bin.23]
MPQPDLALQGNLFGDAEPASSPPSKGQKREDEPDQLDDHELTQDAKQRPRQRQLQRQGQQPHSELTSNNSNHDANSD